MPPDRHETQPFAEIMRVERAKCRRECDLVLSRATLCGDRARRGREMQASGRGQPSAEIVRVECPKRRRECDLSRSRATLCGDRACRGDEMQARVRFVPVAGNPLRKSCASSARNAGESEISAEIVRVEGTKCRRECDVPVRRNPLRRSCVSTL